MRSEKAIRRAIEEIGCEVRGRCPNDPFYAACEPDVVIETLRWVLEETARIQIETDEAVFEVDENGIMTVAIHFTTTD